MMNLRAMIVALTLAGSATVFGGCATSGFVQLSEASAPAPDSQAMPLYASKEIGRPYRVLGYVFRTTEGHREGMNPEAPGVYVLQQDSEEVMELRRVAAQKGADAIVGVEMFPTFTTFGQAIGVSIGGLAVKFENTAGVSSPASVPDESTTSGNAVMQPATRATTPPAPAGPPANHSSSSTPPTPPTGP